MGTVFLDNPPKFQTIQPQIQTIRLDCLDFGGGLSKFLVPLSRIWVDCLDFSWCCLDLWQEFRQSTPRIQTIQFETQTTHTEIRQFRRSRFDPGQTLALGFRAQSEQFFQTIHPNSRQSHHKFRQSSQESRQFHHKFRQSAQILDNDGRNLDNSSQHLDNALISLPKAATRIQTIQPQI